VTLENFNYEIFIAIVCFLVQVFAFQMFTRLNFVYCIFIPFFRIILPFASYMLEENSDAKLGDIVLLFQSPVLFKTSNNEIEVTNNFVLKLGSPIQHQDVESIKKNQLLSVPIITGAYNGSIETIIRFSVVVKLNGNEILKNSYQYDEPWPTGLTPTISIPVVYTGNQ